MFHAGVGDRRGNHCDVFVRLQIHCEMAKRQSDRRIARGLSTGGGLSTAMDRVRSECLSWRVGPTDEVEEDIRCVMVPGALGSDRLEIPKISG
jgi:hypothetical protein